MIKDVVYTGSRNLYKVMVPSVKSLLLNGNVDEVWLLIEDDEFPSWLPENVHVINVSDQKYFKKDGPNMRSKFTWLAMMRAALAKVFPDVDLILSLDCDVIINKDLSDLWNYDYEDYYFCASKEKHRSHNGLFYTNTGVCMYNLKKLRDDKKVDEVIEVLNKQAFTWLEQDVFNYLCQGRILEMPGDFNANNWTEHGDDPYITHYAGIPDWTHYQLYQDYVQLSWDKISGKG